MRCFSQWGKKNDLPPAGVGFGLASAQCELAGIQGLRGNSVFIGGVVASTCGGVAQGIQHLVGLKELQQQGRRDQGNVKPPQTPEPAVPPGDLSPTVRVLHVLT